VPQNLYRFLLVAFFFFQIGKSYTQPVSSPDLKCLSVSWAGDVTLMWTIPSDPGGKFLNYKIYSSLAFAGSYSLVTTINTYTQTSYTHVGANANASRIYYRIQTEYNPGSVLSSPLDTPSTIFLSVSGATTANLLWNKVSLHPNSSSTGWYKVFREYPKGTWALRDRTKNTFYSDIIDVCNNTNESINYRIQTDDTTGYTSISNVAGIVLTDQTAPKIAPVDTLSVDPLNNLATISWNPSPSPDTDSIIIYKLAATTGKWLAIATVNVPQTSYTSPVSNAKTISEYYCIAFVDSCGNISPLGTYHNTIHLSSTFDICSSTAKLVWNKYANWNSGAVKYTIFRSTNGGVFSSITTKDVSDTSYVDTGLMLGTSYCYIVKAINGVKTSSSNKVCFIANVSKPPQFTYNRFATVTSPTSILVKGHVDFSSSVKYYRIQRTTPKNGFFSIIAPAILPSAGTISYIDNSVNTTSNSYIYKIEVMDSCQHVIMTSNLDTTIHLVASIDTGLKINLNWNNYGTWLGSVGKYEIYRAIDGVWDSYPIATTALNKSGGSYTDDVSPYFSSKGSFSYYVKAIEGSGNSFGFTDSSTSNIAFVNEYPKFYIPNIFTPNGDNLNDVFLPIIGFFDRINYSMMIFDNTGTPCFETNDPTVGWDGKIKGHLAMSSVYMYLIRCKAANGNDSKMSGTLTLTKTLFR
jgi:gliding motility-associated-like protein